MGGRLGRAILVVIALAVVALCISLWVNEGPLWRLVMLRTVCYDDGSVRWRCPVRRFTEPAEVFIESRVLLEWIGFSMSTTGAGTLQKFPGTPHGEFVSWWPDGLLREKGNHDEGEPNGKWTIWYASGKVQVQHDYLRGTIQDHRTSPPWWDGVTDQTEPTDPRWIAEHGKQ